MEDVKDLKKDDKEKIIINLYRCDKCRYFTKGMSCTLRNKIPKNITEGKSECKDYAKGKIYVNG